MLKSNIAVIYFQEKYFFDKKICGLYPLERLIHVLAAAGFEKVYMNLAGEELSFYNKKISRHLKRIKSLEIIQGSGPERKRMAFRIPSGLFLQPHYFNDPDLYFTKKGNSIIPVIKEDQFIVTDKRRVKQAAGLIEKRLIETTHGYIAKNINKKISVPMSRVISATRIHPNILTLINFIIGSLGAYLVFLNHYWSAALGGALFQLASVFDGIDGEVAKFTFRSSKFGGWLDTVCDHLILVFIFAAMSYHFVIDFGPAVSIITVGTALAGLILMIYVSSAFLKKFNTSQSLKAYETDFIIKLPPDDLKVAFILKTRFLIKKEFYSLIFFLAGLTGKMYYTIPVFSIVSFAGAMILFRINRQYFPVFNEKYRVSPRSS